MSLEKNYNNTKPAAQMFNQNGPGPSPLFGTLQRGFSVSEMLGIFLKTPRTIKSNWN